MRSLPLYPRLACSFDQLTLICRSLRIHTGVGLTKARPERVTSKRRSVRALMLITIGSASVMIATPSTTQETRSSISSEQPGLQAYDRIASVLQSPRCINCHPSNNRPAQGDDRHVHLFNVQRGDQDKGVPAMRCSTCHQAHNNDMAGVPGALHWQLAPASMGWVGLSKAELCLTLLDRRKNGNRSVADLVTHMTNDTLVLWAWNPGRGRTPPPLSFEAFKLALDQWAKAGATCPS